MGMVVIEGDVFAVDNRELKKRGAWVVAFDLTDYTGSIRVNKFFPPEELPRRFTPVHRPADSTAVNLAGRNVVIFIMESMSARCV